MSGSTIGGVIGGVIGFYVGGPSGAQYGWMIGSTIGGIVDPEVIKSPGIGDAQQQTSADGVPIAVVYGTPPPFMGNIIDGEVKARKITVEEGGKGGPIVESERFLLTSAIGICEGEIEGVAWIVQDGNLVYDVRPNSSIPGETEKFRSKIRLYNGTETQLPDPALEAIHGVGNTPYYRGLAYMVIVDDDRTASQGRVGQYAFGVVKTGTTDDVTAEIVLPAEYGQFVNEDWPLAGPSTHYTYQGNRGGVLFDADTIEEIINHFAGTYPTGKPEVFLGYTAGENTETYNHQFSGTKPQNDVTANVTVQLIYNDVDPDVFVSVFNGDPTQCALMSAPSTRYCDAAGNIMFRSPTSNPAYTGFFSCGADFLIGMQALLITVARRHPGVVEEFGDPCLLEQAVLLPDTPSMTIDCDGAIDRLPALAPAVGSYVALQSESITFDATLKQNVLTRYTVGPVLEVGDPAGTSAFWMAADAAAVAAGTVPAGRVYGVDYPQSIGPGDVIYSATTQKTSIESGQVLLSDIQQDLAMRCRVPVDRIDVSELLDIVPGYLVATPSSGADCSRPLQQVFFYDMPEADGAIRCIMRGKSPAATLTEDDLVDVDSDDDDIRSQQVEFPKKIHLAYPDPVANYAITKQTFERESSNVHAVGETIVQTPIPFSNDEAAQRVDVMGKVAWATAEGEFKRTLGPEWQVLTPSDCFVYNGKRWRIGRADYGDGTVAIEAIYDRQSAYSSIATGAESRPPATNTSSMRGPTTFAAMNLPSLQSADNVPGMYIACGNILDSWRGCTVMLSVDGGASFQPVLTITAPAVLGFTTSATTPTSEPISVKVHGELDTATADQIAARANAFALVSLAGVAEIGQFEVATETGEGQYDLTTVTRGELGTVAADHPSHTRFVLLDARVKFLPLDVSLAGRTLIFRPVSIGTPGANHADYSVVFEPPTFIIDGGGA